MAGEGGPEGEATHLDWGDNLESVSWTDRSVIRVEMTPFAQLQDPLVYLLGAAAAVALTAWWFEGRGLQGAAGWPLDAIVITCVVMLNAVLGWLQEAKAAQAVAALAKMTTATSAVLPGRTTASARPRQRRRQSSSQAVRSPSVSTCAASIVIAASSQSK